MWYISLLYIQTFLEKPGIFFHFLMTFFFYFLQKKKQRTNMISSDEDDESDDEEKAREEMQGFIAVSITKVSILCGIWGICSFWDQKNRHNSYV